MLTQAELKALTHFHRLSHYGKLPENRDMAPWFTVTSLILCVEIC
jgi:hypothetical protein